ncbi:PH domain-containing protein [Streptomyces chromofuscus]|uniref:PH domain-containing protein n=1 Tax=Streptomyces chromofuscus TaxID=42881 RepID=A0A7M2TC75_STRCW|nr:PH domain-containing protein [Streptomyces chromofuscus]QOV45543.1 PH domain-containing protein [Streptomyces chromofuscus]GGT20001.1 membrane protein [Streptomyces chromofuscus]
MSDLPTLPVTFRPGRTRAVLLTAAVAIFVIVSSIALLLDRLGPGERMSFVFLAALLAAVALMLARPKVVADDTGVTVVNFASTRRLAWAEIVQVHLRVGDPWVFLDLSDGTSLAAIGIQPGIAKAQAVADARALRALVEARSGESRD